METSHVRRGMFPRSLDNIFGRFENSMISTLICVWLLMVDFWCDIIPRIFLILLYVEILMFICYFLLYLDKRFMALPTFSD